MSWRSVRKLWITLSNVAAFLLISIGYVQDSQITGLHGRFPPRTPTFDAIISAVLIGVLVMATASEWLNWSRLALFLNASFWGFWGLLVLGELGLRRFIGSSYQHDPEAGLAIALVGIPFTLIMIIDLVLYYVTWRDDRVRNCT